MEGGERWTALCLVNGGFSHPSRLCPQKDGRKIRWRDRLPLVLVRRRRWLGTEAAEPGRRLASVLPFSVTPGYSRLYL